MICPTCRAVTDEAVAVCPVCDQPYSRAKLARVIEGAFTLEDTPPDEWQAQREQEATTTALVAASRVSTLPSVVLPSPGAALAPMLRALPRLPALAWRQPVVRAAVRTGASAVAVSLATRMATHWLTRRVGRQALSQNALEMLPLLGDGLGEHALHPRRGRGQRVTVETFVYLRRTISTE